MTVDGFKSIVATQAEEIERLRADRDAFHFVASTTLAERDAEIERLRGQLLNVLDMVGDTPIEQLRQEAEKLRMEIPHD